MKNQMKMTSLPQNPQLVLQVDLYTKEANKLIRNSQYRKCIIVLDSYYKKLLPIESPFQMRLKLLRRLCYCVLQFFKKKIVKFEVNQSTSQQVLWHRLQLYIREFHESIQLIKNRKKKQFYCNELFKYILQSYQYRSIYFAHNGTVAMGVLSFQHRFDKIVTSLELLKNSYFTLTIGIRYILTGSIYFQLTMYEPAMEQYLLGLNLFQYAFGKVYQEQMMYSQEQLKSELQKYAEYIIITLFLMSSTSEELRDMEQYQEIVKLALWFSTNFLDKDSQLLIALSPFLDLNKHIQHITELREIRKVLIKIFGIVQKKEPQANSARNDLVEYFEEALYKFDNLENLQSTYYFIDKTQAPYPQELIQSHLQDSDRLDMRSSLKKLIRSTNKDTDASDSTIPIRGIYSSQQRKKMTNPISISSRMQTDNLTTTELTQNKSPTSTKRIHTSLEDITLNHYYGQIIEQSCKMDQIKEEGEQMKQDMIEKVKMWKEFNKSCQTSKTKLHFKGFYGNGTIKTDQGHYFKSIKSIKKRTTENLRVTELLIQQNINVKRLQEQPIIISTTPNRFKMDSPKNMKSLIVNHRKQLGLDSRIKWANVHVDLPNIQPDQEQDEQAKQQQINNKNTEIIKMFMDEKETQLSKQKIIIKKTQHQYQAGSILQKLLTTNDDLAKSTDLISSKKLTTVKSLVDLTNKKQAIKRMTTFVPMTLYARDQSQKKQSLLL